jgi:hypothetical protein
MGKGRLSSFICFTIAVFLVSDAQIITICAIGVAVLQGVLMAIYLSRRFERRERTAVEKN